MPVDANKLRRVRRNLGSPPTDGSPEIEVSAVGTPSGNHTEPVEWPEPLSSSMPVLKPEPHEADTPTAARDHVLQRTEPGAAKVHHSRVGTERVHEGAAPTSRYRIPPRESEPRVPFTTRIAASTKERLEDACYHLRTKHQAFIDEAIRQHLEKHGF